MRTLTKRLFIIILALSAVAGGTVAFFSDTELSFGNTFAAGTIDIELNSQNPWNERIAWENILPGDTKETTITIKNVGENTAEIFKRISALKSDENGVIEPEQEWYHEHNGGVPKNDIENAVIYEMLVGADTLIPATTGITIAAAAEAYIYVGKLDPGQSLVVRENYSLPFTTENWAQSDTLTFDLEFLALQLGAPKPSPAFEFLENKVPAGAWPPIADARFGILRYVSVGEVFDYALEAYGLDPALNYCLIYYADGWPGNHPGYYFGSRMPDTGGRLSISGSVPFPAGLPDPADANFPAGFPDAKIWLVDCADYNSSTRSMSSWHADRYLLDYWPAGITYTQGVPAEYGAGNETTPETRIISINDAVSPSTGQYGYDLDYSLSTVSFKYDTPSAGALEGELSASGLKPYFTYQAKLEGKPACKYGATGNDQANERIGYLGRWWDETLSANVSDADYLADSAYHGGTHCIIGYLVWDFFTADSAGSAVKMLKTDNSYHVLRCGGGVCDAASDALLSALDPDRPGLLLCQTTDVNGELERGTCGSLGLGAGEYDLKMILTEESFHQGPWKSVLIKDINFTIY